MEKRTVISEMKSFNNGSSYITIGMLAKHLGKSKEFAANLVAGLDRLPGEKNGTKYFVPDVAGRIMDRRQGGH